MVRALHLGPTLSHDLFRPVILHAISNYDYSQTKSLGITAKDTQDLALSRIAAIPPLISSGNGKPEKNNKSERNDSRRAQYHLLHQVIHKRLQRDIIREDGLRGHTAAVSARSVGG